MKTCPCCRNKIQDAATVCSFCHRDPYAQAAADAVIPTIFATLIGTVAICASLVVAGLIIESIGGAFCRDAGALIAAAGLFGMPVIMVPVALLSYRTAVREKEAKIRWLP